MRTEAELLERYDDVLARGDDAALLRLVRDLDAAYPAPWVPERPPVEAIRARAARGSAPEEVGNTPTWPAGTPGDVGSPDTNRSSTGRRPERRIGSPSPVRRTLSRALGAIGLATFAAAVVLIAGGLAVVLPSMRSDVQVAAPETPVAQETTPITPELRAALAFTFRQSPYTRDVIARGLGRQLNASATVDGYSLTLTRAYADSKYIFLGLWATPPKGRPIADIHIDDIAARTLAPSPVEWPFGRAGVLTLADDPDQRLEPYLQQSAWRGNAYVLGFEAPELSPDARELRLRLELPGVVAREVLDSRRPETVPHGAACEDVYSWLRCRRVLGPFAFAFTVPVEAVTPRYYDPQLAQALINLTGHLEEYKLQYSDARDAASRRFYDQKARALLTPEFSRKVRDLAALPIPHLKDTSGARTDGLPRGQQVEPSQVTETQASMVTRYSVKGKLVVRRFNFERTDAGWRIGGIEVLAKDPEPWNYEERFPNR